MADKEKTKKNEFVEIEFVGFANGEIFDTTIRKEAEKINLKIDEKPLVVCIGHEMLMKGFDKELEGKELAKKYKVKLSPEESFGKRNPQLIKIIPASIFRKQEMTPAPGLVLNMDGMLAKILSVSGGRVITDFNNPLAGKDIEYEFTIKREVTDEKEKIDSIQDFFFKKRFDFKVESNKIIFNKEAQDYIENFKAPFKDILGKDIEAEREAKTDEKKEETKAMETKKEENKADADPMIEGKKKRAVKK